MANAPDQQKTQAATTGDAETLEPVNNDAVETKPKATNRIAHNPVDSEKRRHALAFRPSHKAMFIGLAVVIVILAINAGVLAFLLKKESANQKAISDKGVSISPSTLKKLGVNDTQIGSSNEQLVVNPSAQFNSQLKVAGNVQIGGQLHLNSTFNATTADISQLQAGTANVNSININGSATASTLSVRNNFAVNGAAQFQNAVTVAQLLSVDNSAAVANNLSVGGDLSANTIATGGLVLSGSIQIGSHIITAGLNPSVTPAGATLGTSGSVSISGDDIAGTIDVNAAGNAAGTGPVVYVLFHAGYSTKPVIVITPVNSYGEFYVAGVSTSGFDIDTASPLTPGASYSINYLVEQ